MEEIGGKYKISIPCPDGRVGCGVCHYIWVDEDAFSQIHDRYYDNYGIKPSERIVAQIYRLLPKELHNLAKQWGWNDTEVGEEVSRWFHGKIILTS